MSLQTVRHTLTIDNPLGDTEIVFADPVCSSPAVHVTCLRPLTGRPEGAFLVEYRPLVPTVGTEEVELSLHSDQLGDYRYILRLRASKAGAESALRFKTDLGAVHAQTLRYVVMTGAARAPGEECSSWFVRPC